MAPSARFSAIQGERVITDPAFEDLLSGFFEDVEGSLTQEGTVRTLENFILDAHAMFYDRFVNKKEKPLAKVKEEKAS